VVGTAATGNQPMHICFITTGGTIDKVYFDAKSDFEVGATVLDQVLHQGETAFDYRIVELMRKDSLELTDDDRSLIRQTVAQTEARRFVITHGTDTMVDTARALLGLEDKIVVLTGALSPARFLASDAAFNVGMAVAAVQCQPPGVYIAMNGRVFDPLKVRKNRAANRFEPLD
jgi:L-asparaginase